MKNLQLNSRHTGSVINKSYEMKIAAISDDGTMTGDTSVTGRLDRGRDCIFPGAFGGTLEGFLKNGFVAVGHDWGNLPVAFPVSAQESGRSLLSTARFHSTERGQEARTVVKERLDAGMSVGLSVGFLPDYAEGVLMFRTGAAMLAYAKANGYDLGSFDVAGIEAHAQPCRAITKIVELFEFSICTVPMNPSAGVTEAKGYYGGDYDNGSEADTAADATIAALRQLDYRLWRSVYSVLYNNDTVIADKTTALADCYETYSEQSVAVIEALLTALADATVEDSSATMLALQSARLPGVVTLAGKELPGGDYSTGNTGAANEAGATKSDTAPATETESPNVLYLRFLESEATRLGAI